MPRVWLPVMSTRIRVSLSVKSLRVVCSNRLVSVLWIETKGGLGNENQIILSKFSNKKIWVSCFPKDSVSFFSPIFFRLRNSTFTRGIKTGYKRDIEISLKRKFLIEGDFYDSLLTDYYYETFLIPYCTHLSKNPNSLSSAFRVWCTTI